MSKSADATNWEVIAADEEGLIGCIEYICPYCEEKNWNMCMFSGRKKREIIDSGSWETDQVCKFCEKNVAIAYHK